MLTLPISTAAVSCLQARDLHSRLSAREGSATSAVDGKAIVPREPERLEDQHTLTCYYLAQAASRPVPLCVSSVGRCGPLSGRSQTVCEAWDDSIPRAQ